MAADAGSGGAYVGIEAVSIRMWRTSMVLCCAWLIHGGAIAGSPTTPPHPRGDFPTLDRFYPVAAEVWGEEGAVVVHFCVDEKGELSEDPTVDQSSGNDCSTKGPWSWPKPGLAITYPVMRRDRRLRVVLVSKSPLY